MNQKDYSSAISKKNAQGQNENGPNGSVDGQDDNVVAKDTQPTAHDHVDVALEYPA